MLFSSYIENTEVQFAQAKLRYITRRQSQNTILFLSEFTPKAIIPTIYLNNYVTLIILIIRTR